MLRAALGETLTPEREAHFKGRLHTAHPTVDEILGRDPPRGCQPR